MCTRMLTCVYHILICTYSFMELCTAPIVSRIKTEVVKWDTFHSSNERHRLIRKTSFAATKSLSTIIHETVHHTTVATEVVEETDRKVSTVVQILVVAVKVQSLPMTAMHYLN